MYKYEGKTIIEIYEGHSDEKKYVHFLGYGYYANGMTEEKPYRFVEYAFFCYPIEMVLERNIFENESDYGADCKQFIEDCTEERMVEIYETYDYGKLPKEIKREDINLDTPCGMYIVM